MPIRLNRTTSQQNPPPRLQNWYDDPQALKRVYPTGDILTPNYNSQDPVYEIEMKFLMDRLRVLANEFKITIYSLEKNKLNHNNIINSFSNDIKYLLHPELDNISKFNGMTPEKLKWLKRYLETIIDYAVRYNDAGKIEETIEVMNVCGGGSVNTLRSIADQCTRPNGLLESLAQTRIATIYEITSRHISDRNKIAEKDSEGEPILHDRAMYYEKHIPIVFHNLAMLQGINIPVSAVRESNAVSDLEDDESPFDSHPTYIN